MREKDSGNSTIFDDVIRTAQERQGKLFVPMVNETFGEHYPKDTPVTRLPDDYQKVVSKVVADACNVIGDRVYHVECQSRNDKTMVLRMVEYDFMIGLSMAENENGTYRIRFPRSCVIYLRQNGNTSKEEEMELLLQDGQVVKYRVPVVLVQSYSLDEIFQKQLYLFLPFYIMRYEHDMAEIASNDSRKDALLEEYEDILKRLEETMADEPDIFQDLLQLMRKVADYQLGPYFELREEVGAVMGGKVLPLPSDVLREARAEGMQQGIEQGIEQSMEQSIRNLMETMQWSAEQAMQALKVPDSEQKKYLKML